MESADLMQRTRPEARSSSDISGNSAAISGPLLCYGFSSDTRIIGGGLGQFRPILMPVMRAHFLAGDCPVGELLNRLAMFGGYCLFPANYFGNEGWRYINGSR